MIYCPQLNENEYEIAEVPNGPFLQKILVLKRNIKDNETLEFSDIIVRVSGDVGKDAKVTSQHKIIIDGTIRNKSTVISKHSVEGNDVEDDVCITSSFNVTLKNVGNNVKINAHDHIKTNDIGERCILKSEFGNIGSNNIGSNTQLEAFGAISVKDLLSDVSIVSKAGRVRAGHLGKNITIIAGREIHFSSLDPSSEDSLVLKTDGSAIFMGDRPYIPKNKSEHVPQNAILVEGGNINLRIGPGANLDVLKVNIEPSVTGGFTTYVSTTSSSKQKPIEKTSAPLSYTPTSTATTSKLMGSYSCSSSTTFTPLKQMSVEAAAKEAKADISLPHLESQLNRLLSQENVPGCRIAPPVFRNSEAFTLTFFSREAAERAEKVLNREIFNGQPSLKSTHSSVSSQIVVSIESGEKIKSWGLMQSQQPDISSERQSLKKG